MSVNMCFGIDLNHLFSHRASFLLLVLKKSIPKFTTLYEQRSVVINVELNQWFFNNLFTLGYKNVFKIMNDIIWKHSKLSYDFYWAGSAGSCYKCFNHKFKKKYRSKKNQKKKKIKEPPN